MGYVLILNNDTFNTESLCHRQGSIFDVKYLKEVFHKFNCRIKVVRNPSLEEIRSNINNIQLQDELRTAKFLFVIIMSHGAEGDTAFAKDEIYNITDEIVYSQAFQKNLPKILITQACKFSPTSIQRKNSLPPKDLKVENYFRFDSTFENHYAILYNDGAPFIQTLCEQIIKYGNELNILEIANEVIKTFESKYKNCNRKQFPTKKSYFVGRDKVLIGEAIQRHCTVISNEFVQISYFQL